MEVKGLKVGYAEDINKGTGVTVFIPDEPSPCAYHVHGFAPGTRQMDSLNPYHPVNRIDAVLFVGGSAYGLESAGGVMQYLKEKGRGINFGSTVVPVVPTAAIFDLMFLKDTPPSRELAYEACMKASNQAFQGSVGAGCGATVGKLLTIKYAMKGGSGTGQVKIGEDILLTVFAVVNAFGDIIDPSTGRIIAGSRNPVNENKILDAREYLRKEGRAFSQSGENTTLLLIHVNARVDRVNLKRLCAAGASSLSRVINPSPSPFDGDVAFAISTGNKEVNFLSLISAVPEAVEKAVLSAIKYADGFEVVPAWKDLYEGDNDG